MIWMEVEPVVYWLDIDLCSLKGGKYLLISLILDTFILLFTIKHICFLFLFKNSCLVFILKLAGRVLTHFRIGITSLNHQIRTIALWPILYFPVISGLISKQMDSYEKGHFSTIRVGLSDKNSLLFLLI